MKDDTARRLPSAGLSLSAGLVNGLLGTGGGMILVLGLRRIFPGQEREVMAISTAAVLSFSILSIILYTISGNLTFSEATPVILPALAGGFLGSLLLGRIRLPWLDAVLAALLIISGIRMLL